MRIAHQAVAPVGLTLLLRIVTGGSRDLTLWVYEQLLADHDSSVPMSIHRTAWRRIAQRAVVERLITPAEARLLLNVRFHTKRCCHALANVQA